MADRFEQLSQAFLQLGNNPGQSNNSSGIKQIKQTRFLALGMNKDRESIGSDGNEDSAQSSVLSMFNIGI